jgi:ankyrin repeat protein
MYRSSRLCKSSIYLSSSYIQVKKCGFRYFRDCSRCSRLGIKCSQLREPPGSPPDSALVSQILSCTTEDKERFLSHIGGQLLLWGSKEGHFPLVELLLEVGGINVNFEDSDKRTSLDHVMSRGNQSPAVLERLLQAGASITAVDSILKITPLHRAALYYKTYYRSDIALLLEANADIDATDKYGNTPLHLAAQYGPVETVEELIAANAKLEKADSEGRTALHLATYSYRRVSVINRLLGAGCNSLARDRGGEIPLDLAFRSVEYLEHLWRDEDLTTSRILLRDWQMRLKLPTVAGNFEWYSFDEMKQYYIANGGKSGGTR